MASVAPVMGHGGGDRRDHAPGPRTSPRVQLGSDALRAVQSHLVPVNLSLADVLAGRVPVLPPLDRTAHGYSVRSLPFDRRDAMVQATRGMIAAVRRHYVRYYATLAADFDAYFAALPGRVQTMLATRASRVAALSGGRIEVSRHRAPAEMQRFLDIAHRIAQRGYHHRLPGGAMPDDDAFAERLTDDAAKGRARCWVLYVSGEPAAYIHATLVGDIVRLNHCGDDPAFAEGSPAALLLLDAIRDLHAEGAIRHVDFGQGRLPHHRLLATSGVNCVDLLLLRASLANRIATVVMRGYDEAAGAARHLRQTVKLPAVPLRWPRRHRG